MYSIEDRVTTLYQELYGPEITMSNLDSLAEKLSAIAGRDRPWTGKYLHSLIKGYEGFTANDKMLEAISILGSRVNGIDEVKLLAKETTVLSVNSLPPQTVILGKARRCANPACTITFVPTHPRQKYHSKRCTRSNYKSI